MFTGLRIGELCALRWDGVSLRDGTIRIAATLQRLRDTDAAGGARSRQAPEPTNRVPLCANRVAP